MPTTSFLLPSLRENHQIIVAMLDDPDIEGFLELDHAIVAYVREAASSRLRATIESDLQSFLTGPIEENVIEPRNWNEEWEKTITPIRAGVFRIRPSWSQVEELDGVIDVIIDPKMSFGTGYHESTRLMLRYLDELIQEGDRVLDAGTGTGVLSFAALKSGASVAEAFDTDPICYDNATENALLNGLQDRFRVWVGDETSVTSQEYDLIFANINREALRAMLPSLASKLAPGGRLGLSGLLLGDREMMLGQISVFGLITRREGSEGEWWSVWAERNE